MPLVTIHDAGGDNIQFMEVDGVFYPYVEGANQDVSIKASREAKARDGDVLLVNYPKSGTHWLWEMLSMLHNGTADTIQKIKQTSFMEGLSEKQMTSLLSPRVLNTHFRFGDLPTDMVSKRTKIIVIHRNPKDVSVSHYNHHLNLNTLYKYNGKWKNWLPLFLEGKVDNGSWFEYVRDWETVMEQHPDYPIHLVFYEDLKQNGAREIEKIAKFLELPVSSELCAAISEKCKFSNMVKDKKGLENDFWTNCWRDSKPGYYRKGEVGDWKNWFTIAQSEQFDDVYAEKMAGSKLKFRFEI